MIQCPYCSAEMADEASSCPRCLSLLVKVEYKTKALPRYLHPAVALLMVLVAAGGLLFLSYRRNLKWLSLFPARSTAPAGPAADTSPNSAASPGASPAVSPVETTGDNLYNQIVEYEKRVMELLALADSLADEMDKFLRGAPDKKNVPALAQKINELGNLLGQLRSLTPVPQLQRTHTTLANAFARRQRGYREMMFYLDSGDVNRLNSGRDDLNLSRKYREQALAEIKAIKESHTPPPAPPPPEPEPAPAGTVTISPPESGTSTLPGASVTPSSPEETPPASPPPEPPPETLPAETAFPEPEIVPGLTPEAPIPSP